jgi:hypothetical protein
MNTTISGGLIRLVAGPVAAAGIIGGALGLAAVANATIAPAPTPAAHVVDAQQADQPNKAVPTKHVLFPNIMSHNKRTP